MTGHLCCFAPSSRWLILFSCGYIKLWHSQAQLWCIRWEVRSKWKRQRSHGGRTLPGQWRKLSSTLLLSHACLWQCHKKSRGRIACFWSSCNFTAQGCKVHKVQVSKEMQIRYIEKFQSYSWHRFKKKIKISSFSLLFWKAVTLEWRGPCPQILSFHFMGIPILMCCFSSQIGRKQHDNFSLTSIQKPAHYLNISVISKKAHETHTLCFSLIFSFTLVYWAGYSMHNLPSQS